MENEKIIEQAKELFFKNRGRKEVIDFINSKGIEGQQAEDLATQAYKSVKEKINHHHEVEEHNSLGGPWGKIGIGLFAIAIGFFGVFALERIFYIIFLIGFGLIGTGVIGFFNNPKKKKI